MSSAKWRPSCLGLNVLNKFNLYCTEYIGENIKIYIHGLSRLNTEKVQELEIHLHGWQALCIL